MQAFLEVASLIFSLLALIPSAHAGAKSIQTRSLTFGERVAYQYAIEEVYWRHRIWPKDNPERKSSLDAIVSRHKIEEKVEDYLRKSQAVADKRGSPISTTELQAEMERTARDTKRPDMLRELFQ